eukprot:scaffold225_cov235-Pinguiococcus_pyrenoidosus.AAC.1
MSPPTSAVAWAKKPSEHQQSTSLLLVRQPQDCWRRPMIAKAFSPRRRAWRIRMFALVFGVQRVPASHHRLAWRPSHQAADADVVATSPAGGMIGGEICDFWLQGLRATGEHKRY